MPEHTAGRGGDRSAQVQTGHGISSVSSKLGELLVEKGIISEIRLQEALNKQSEDGGFLGHVLVEMRYLDQQTLTLFLIKQCKIPHLNLLDYQIDKNALKLVSEEFCQKYGVLPVDKMGDFLTLAMVDPLSTEALDVIRESLPELRIKPILCNWDHFLAVFSNVFGLKDTNVEAVEIAADTFNLPAAAKTKKIPVARIVEEKEESNHTPNNEQISVLLEGLSKTIGDAITRAFAKVNVGGQSEAFVKLEENLATLTNTVSEVVQAARLVQTAREVETGLVAQGTLQDLCMPKPGYSASVYDIAHRGTKDDTRAGVDRSVLEALDTGTPIQGFAFDSFFPGSTNEFAFAMCKAVAAKPGKEYNPFFLCGSVGLGKTHLVNAIGNALVVGDPDMRVGYCSAGRFADHVNRATRGGNLDGFRAQFARLDALILDDIQFLGGRIEAQEEFFHIFNALHQQQRQIIIAADKPPAKLGLLEDRLISRFSGGIVAYLEAPDLSARLAILKYQAKVLEVEVPGEVLGLVAAGIETDMRKLTGCLQKIVAFATLKGQDITCQMASEILADPSGVDAA